MPFAADSSIATRVVPSPSSEVGPRNGASIDAICIHMAEGGGTVEWLTRPDGNSSHYVVRYTGQVVQMVRESYWAGSINPRLVRIDDDKPYTYQGITITYGRTEATRCLGTGVTNPNLHVIAVEVEGFAAAGPNADQRRALAELVADIRRRRGWLPCLGHRDFQNYKACPGKLIPWIDYGGHGKTEPGDTTLDFYPLAGGDGVVKIKAGRGLVNLVTGKAVIPTDTEKVSHCRIHLAVSYGDEAGRQDGYLVRHANQAHIALDDVVETFTPAPTPVPSVTYELSLDGQPVASGSYTKP